MPSLFDLYGLNPSPGLPPPVPPDSGDFGRGFKESFQQLPQLGYGVLAGVGAAGEAAFGEGGIATGIKKAGVRGYTEWGDKIASQAKESDSWSHSYDRAKEGDFGALVDWLQHGLGYVGGQGLQALATAGLGAIGGKFVAGTAAKQIAEGMVAKEAARIGAESAGKLTAEQVAKQATEAVAAKFASIGASTALAGQAIGQEGGEVFGGLTQEAEKEGRSLTGAELGKAFAATLAAGGLEFVGDKIGLDIALGKSPFLKPAQAMQGFAGRVARGGIAAAGTAPIEAGTEFGQTMLEEYGQGRDAFGPETLAKARDAAALGALGGTAIGAAGGALRGPREHDPVPAILAAPDIDRAIEFSTDALFGDTKKEPTTELGAKAPGDGIPFEADPLFTGRPVLGQAGALPAFGSKQAADVWIGQSDGGLGQYQAVLVGDRWQVTLTPAAADERARGNIDRWAARAEPMSEGRAREMVTVAQEQQNRRLTAIPLPDGTGWTAVPSEWVVGAPGMDAYADEALAAGRWEAENNARIRSEALAPRTLAPSGDAALPVLPGGRTLERDLAGITLDAEAARAEAQKAADLERMPADVRAQDEQAAAVARAATLEGESPMAAALRRAMPTAETGSQAAPLPPDAGAQAPAVPPVAAAEPRIVPRTPDMRPMSKLGAETQAAKIPGSEVVRIRNRSGKYTYTLLKPPAPIPASAPAAAGPSTPEAEDASPRLPSAGDVFTQQGVKWTIVSVTGRVMRAKSEDGRSRVIFNDSDGWNFAVRYAKTPKGQPSLHDGASGQVLGAGGRASEAQHGQREHTQPRHTDEAGGSSSNPGVGVEPATQAPQEEGSGIEAEAEGDAGSNPRTGIEPTAEALKEDLGAQGAQPHLAERLAARREDKRRTTLAAAVSEAAGDKVHARKRVLEELAQCVAGGSLTLCLRKAGSAIEPSDRAAILASAAKLRRGGKPTRDASMQAVRSRLDVLNSGKLDEAPAPAKIEDFGEKLAGARKDYAAALKDRMAEAAAVDLGAEPLSKSWPEPDYAKLLEGGADPWMVSFVRAARDEVPTKPQSSWKLKGWVENVKLLRDVSTRLLDGSITREAVEAKLWMPEFRNVRSAIGGRAELYREVGHERSLKGVTLQEHHYTRYRDEENVRKWVVEQKAKATMFSNWPRELAIADTKEEALAQFKAKLDSLDLGPKAKGQPQFVIYTKRGQEGAWIGKKIGRQYVDLKRVDDVAKARTYMAENTAELEALLASYKETPLERRPENQPRVGDDHRNGAPVTPEAFADAFGFRGVQFGNYVEQGRRQSDLNEAFDALMDMAGVLGIPARALSLNGRLGLAFGARGRGGKSAPAAHFEPGKVVINLTKGGGPGSLAHEWWHALDNYFAGDGRSFVTAGARADMREQMRLAFEAVKKATQASGLNNRSMELDERRSTPYWSKHEELSARSFETYVIAKLEDQNAANDYLANVVSQQAWDATEGMRAIALGRDPDDATGTYLYPTADEMPAVRAAFDEFFRVIETRQDEAGNVALFSRAAPFVEVVSTDDGLPTYANAEAGIVLAAPQVTERFEVIEDEGEQVVSYAVMPSDRFDVLGHVVLLLKDGQPVSLIDIEMYHRGDGAGRKVIETVLASTRGNLNISNIVPDARGFWAKMGVPEQNAGAGEAYDGTLNWQTYAEARDAGAARSDAKASRGAGQERDAGTARADRGAAGARTPQGLTRAEAEAIMALPEDTINRLLDRTLSPERVREIAAKVGTHMQVVESVDDLPPTERRAALDKAADGKIRGAYFKASDQAYLIAGNLYSEAEATFVALHESFHRGLVKTLGPDARKVLQWMHATNAKLRTLTQVQMERHGIGQDEAIEEALADLAGKGEARDLRGWTKLLTLIRAWLDKVTDALGFRLTWTDEMVSDFVAGVARAGLDTRVTASASQDTSLSRSESRSTAQDLAPAGGGVFDFNRLGATRQDRIRSVVDGARPFWLGALTRDQLADIYGKDIPAVKEYDGLTRSMENQRSKIAQDADTIYNDWSKLGSVVNDKLARVMLDATVNSVHPDGEFNTITGNDGTIEARRKLVHARLAREFAALPEEAQAMYRRVRDFHAGILGQLREALEKRLQRQIENGEARAAALTSIRQAFDQYAEHGPYFPLSRFGDYLVIGERADGERVVASYETAGEQSTAARALRQDGFTVKTKTAREYSRALDGSAGKFIGQVLTTLQALDFQDAAINGKASDLKSKLLDDINQVFIRSLPDLSYRKHFAHRKNTPGFSSDVMRGFASSAFHAASHIARLNHADQMSFALEDAYRTLDKAPDGDFNAPSQVLNELALRHDAVMNPNTHPIAALLNQVGFVMYLGASPAAGLIQLLQNPMVTLPYLGARYGFGSATAAMGRASKDILGAKMNRESGWNAADSPKLAPVEREVMRKLQDEGVIDLTQAHDLASATSIDRGNVARSKAAFAMSRAMKIVGWTFHIPEVMNRQIAALTAFRLELAKSGDQARAEDAARETIKRSHFDYSASNRARYMQGNLARVVLQFKTFSQNMTYFIGRAAYLALKGEDAEVRGIARRQLMATFAATFAMAGTLGLPGLSMAGGLLSMLVGALDDDDKPWDWKTEFRNLASDVAGQDVGEVLSHGLMRALIPWDVANRVGLGDLWLRSNDREGQSPREAFATDLTNLLGPTAGTILGWYTASEHLGRGNYAKATEAIVPKFVRDAIQAGRFSGEGVTTFSGEHRMDVTGAEVLGKLLGFTPARVSEMYEATGAIKNAETAVLEKRKGLLSRAAQARIHGDSDGTREAMEDIAEFNRRNPKEAIRGSNIAASVIARQRRERQTADGTYLPKTRDHFRAEGRFAEVD